MLAEFLKDYLSIILFLIIALGLSMAFVAINYLASPKNPDPEKLSAYECGFEPFNDSRMEFDVRFYLVAIFLSDSNFFVRLEFFSLIRMFFPPI